MNSLNKPHILYVDDEKENLDGFYFSFKYDYEIFIAQHLHEVNEILSQQSIEVVLIDQKMPEISGIEMIKQLKQSYPDISYILMTAYASLQDALQAINEANIFRFISKPWTYNQINATLSEAIDYYRIKQQNKSLIQELKEQNQKLQVAYDKVAKTDSLKTAFLNNLSHEVRTPLNAIVGFSNLMSDPDLEKEDQIEYGKIIQQRSNDLLKIIDNTITVSQLETNQLEVHCSSFNSNVLLTELYADFEDLNHNINLTVKTSESTTNAVIHTDRDLLKKIFSQLLENAYKFTNSGNITYGLCMLTFKELKQEGFYFKNIIGAENQKRVFYFVEDTGIGIEPSCQHEIFKPFRKLSDDKHEVVGGIGLGLYTCNKLIKLLGGDMALSSIVNKGSRFYFYLA